MTSAIAITIALQNKKPTLIGCTQLGLGKSLIAG
jgi:hypothetical protein